MLRPVARGRSRGCAKRWLFSAGCGRRRRATAIVRGNTIQPGYAREAGRRVGGRGFQIHQDGILINSTPHAGTFDTRLFAELREPMQLSSE